MSEVCCRCYFCYRVHTVASTTVGYSLTCTCGKLIRIPESEAAPDSARDDIPIALRVDPMDADSEAVPVNANAVTEESEREAEEMSDVSVSPSADDADVDPALAIPFSSAVHRSMSPPAFAPPGAFDEEEVIAPVESSAPVEESLPVAAADSADAASDDALRAVPVDSVPEDAVRAVAVEIDPPADEKEVSTPEEPEVPVPVAAPVAESIEEEPREIAAAVAIEHKGNCKMGKGYLVAGIVFLLVWLLHASPWTMFFDEYTAPVTESWFRTSHYLGLERALWSSVFFGMAVACLLEGLCRTRRAAAE